MHLYNVPFYLRIFMEDIRVFSFFFWAACTNFQDKLKERERELRKRKEREEQEMERVRVKVRRKEAVSSYQALLVETIKDPQVVSYYSNVFLLD